MSDGRRDRARLDEVDLQDVGGEEVAGEHAEPGGGPGGDGEAADVAQEARAGKPARARGEREEEAGDPDRERGGERQVAREERVRERGQPDREDEEGRERRLGHEELGHALEVPQDLPPLPHHRRHRGELSADEHEVGDALGDLRARPLGDREPRRLQRRDVVDAVPDHRHVAARGRERLDDALLPLGRDPPDHGCSRPPAGAAPRRPREGRRPSSAAPVSMPASAAIAATVSGASPEMTFSSTPWARKNSTVAPASRRSCSAMTTSPSGARPAGGSSGSGSAGERRRRPEGEHPPPAARLFLHAGAELPEREALGRAEDEGRPAQDDRAPAAARGEGDVALRLLGRRLAGRCDRLERRVPARRGCREAGQRGRELLVVHAGRRDELDHAEAALGEGAGLVEADDVDGGQRLDRVQLLHERPAPGHAERRDRVRQAREQDQPLRDEADDGRDRARDGLVHADVEAPEREAEQERRAAPSRRRGSPAAGSAPARAASGDGGRRGPRRRSARRSSRRRPP